MDFRWIMVKVFNEKVAKAETQKEAKRLAEIYTEILRLWDEADGN